MHLKSRQALGKRSLLGVSLLETLAALVVLSAGAAVMLTWFSQSATALSRLKDAEAVELARLTALDYVRAINPVSRPNGDITLDKYRIAWTSRSIADSVRAVNGLGAAGRYEISLHALDIQVSNADTSNLAVAVKMTLPVAGYKLVAANATASIFGSAAP